MKNHEAASIGAFNLLTEEDKRFVMEIVACFHYRTGTPHPDGSRGQIDISPGQLNNILAYAIMTERTKCHND